MKTNDWRIALAAGLAAASAEAALMGIAGAETRLTVAQSVLAWFACGFVVALARTGLPVLVESLLLTWLIHAAWIIALSVNGGNPERLVPLAVASGVIGLLIGLVRIALARAMSLRRAVGLILMISTVALPQRCSTPSEVPDAGVIEIAKFRKKGGVSDADFLIAMRSLDTFAQAQPGFISREMGPDGKGSWVDVVRWRNQESALAAMQAAAKCEACSKAFALLDPKHNEMNHISVQHRFAK